MTEAQQNPALSALLDMESDLLDAIGAGRLLELAMNGSEHSTLTDDEARDAVMREVYRMLALLTDIHGTWRKGVEASRRPTS